MKERRFPHTLIIIVSFILLAGLATYVLPKGEYNRTFDAATNRELVVPGSYHTIDARPLSPLQVVAAIPRGIAAGAEVIALIFLVGACFYVVDKTGALKDGMMQMTSRLRGREEITLVLTGLFFLAGGALEGMEEEVIPLIPVLLLLGLRLGYDVRVMVSVSYGTTVIGAAFSPMNPFGAVIGQKIAGVPFLHAAGFQTAVMFAAFALWMWMIIRHGNQNRVPAEGHVDLAPSLLSGPRRIILSMVGLAFVVLIYGMMSLGWGFNEISAEFFIVGILSGLVGRLGMQGTCVAYVEGLREMTFASLIVGFAYGISLVLMDGKILDTIIHGLFIPMEDLPATLSALGMTVSQFALHVVVPSYSGQAVLTLPILVPLSDLIGVSRQVCVLAFQYGAILMNLVSPTNGALMAILALSGIGYDKWFLFAGKRLVAILVLAALALGVGEMLGI